MPLPPTTRFSAVDTKASKTNNNNGLYAPELSQVQINAIPAQTKHNGGIWYNTDLGRLETVVKNTVLPIPAGGGGGDVIGPGASVVGNIATFADKTGTTIADGNVSIADVITTPGGAPDDNLSSFTGGTGKVLQDSGIAKVDVVTAAADGTLGKLVQFTGTGRAVQESALDTANLVTNNGTSTDGNIAIFDGTTGKIIKNSAVNISEVAPAAPLLRFSADAFAPNVLVNEIGNLGHLRFTNDVGIIFVDTLMPVEFITNNTGSEDQVCSLFTGGLPTASTTPSALVELQSDSGALLLSRMTTKQRNDLSTPVDANGMLLFNTDNKTFDGFDGTNWRTLPLLNTNGTLTVADPLASSNAATKNYVDTAISSIPAGAITLTGNVTASGFTGSPITTTLNMTLDQIKAPVSSLNLNNQHITNLLTPANSTDAATKGYVDSAVSGIPTATVTLTGDITGSGLVTSPITTTLALTLDQIKAPVANVSLNSKNITNLLDPTTAQQAATKNYVDTRTITLSGAVTGTGALGTTITTVLTNITTSQISDFNTAVVAFRLDQFAVPTASINLNNQKIINLATPIATTDATNKNYVDTRTITLSGAVTGSGALGTTIATTLTNITTSQITNFNSAVTAFRLDQFAAPTSSLNLNNQKIISLATPTASTDGATKGYVDTAISGSGFAPGTLKYIIQKVDASLPNAQSLGALSTGLLKNTVDFTFTGVLSRANPGVDYYAPGSPTIITDNGDNFFIGTNTGNNVAGTTGITGVGVNVMPVIASGCQLNTGLGKNVLQTLTTGNANLAAGANALLSLTTGSNNVALGLSALRNIIASSDNLAIGRNAGITFTSYSSCIFIGNLADATINNLTNAIAIGVGATVSANNCMVLGASGVSVGTGGITPNAQLQLPTLHANRKFVLYETANNDHQIIGLGTAAGTSPSNSFLFNIDNVASNYIFYAAASSSTSNELMRLTGTGYLLVGTTNQSARVNVVGGVQNVAGEDSCIRAGSANTVKIELQSGSLWELRSDNSGGNFSILNRTLGSTPQFTIDTTGNTVYIVKQSYASYYGSASTNTSVTSAGVFAKLNWPTSISTGLNNYTYATSRLTFTSAVTPQNIPQLVQFNITATSNAGVVSPGEITTFALTKNGISIATIRTTLQASTTLSGAIFSLSSVSLSKVTTVVNNDYFEIYVTQNQATGGRTITVTDFNFTISST